MRADVLLGLSQVLGGVDRQPESLVAEGAELPFRGELGERCRLVVAALRETSERLLAEDVDAAADPALDRPALREARDPAVVELDDPERRLRARDGDRRRGAVGTVGREQVREIDVDQLVPVQREDVAALLALVCREADASAAAEALRLLRDRDLDAQASERGRELLAGAGAAADDHALDSGSPEQADLPGSQRAPRDRDERLRQAACDVAETLGLAARQDDRFHYSASSVSRSGVSGRTSSGETARPIPSYAKPAARTASGSRRFRPSMINGCRIAARTSSVASPFSCGHSVTITAASAPVTASSGDS